MTLLKAQAIRISMSRTGNPYDNAQRELHQDAEV